MAPTTIRLKASAQWGLKQNSLFQQFNQVCSGDCACTGIIHRVTRKPNATCHDTSHPRLLLSSIDLLCCKSGIKWKVRSRIKCPDILSVWEAVVFVYFVFPLPLPLSYPYIYISVLLPKNRALCQEEETECLVYRTVGKYTLLVHRTKVLKTAFLARPENTVVPLAPKSSVTLPLWRHFLRCIGKV